MLYDLMKQDRLKNHLLDEGVSWRRGQKDDRQEGSQGAKKT